MIIHADKRDKVGLRQELKIINNRLAVKKNSLKKIIDSAPKGITLSFARGAKDLKGKNKK